MLAVPGKLEDGVDHVFEKFGSGDGAFFGDVADDNDGDIGFFGSLDEKAGAVADLGGRACCGGVVVGGDALDTVDNDQVDSWQLTADS